MEYLLLGFLALWEGARYVRGLVSLRSQGNRDRMKVFHMTSGIAFCLGALFIGISGVYPPVAPVGWVTCGTSLVCAMWMPCSVPVINRLFVLKSTRNSIFLALAVLFIGQGLGLLTW